MLLSSSLDIEMRKGAEEDNKKSFSISAKANRFHQLNIEEFSCYLSSQEGRMMRKGGGRGMIYEFKFNNLIEPHLKRKLFSIKPFKRKARKIQKAKSI